MRPRVLLAIVVAAGLLLAGATAAHAPPPTDTVMRFASAVQQTAVPAPADGQMRSFVHDCEEDPNGIVVGWSARFYVGTYPPDLSQLRPEVGFASLLTVNNPERVTIYWRNNPPGGEAGSVEITVHCARYS